MESVSSNRGKRKIVHESHVYVFSKKTKNEEHGIWVCEKRGSCRGRVWTNGTEGEVVKIVTEHNHAAQAARPEALRLKDQIKDRATTTYENPQQIIGAAVAEAHANVLALLPRKDSLKRTVRKVRNADEDHPPLPLDVESLVIPQSYKEIMVDGVMQQFLAYDSDRNLLPNRMLIFAPPSNLDLLAQSSEWFADGTFSTAPALFAQLYTIHVVRFNGIIPVVYALLPDKSQATYVHLLQELKNLQPGLRPQRLMTDFEQAALQAFDLEFPGITKTGCFFHLCQSIWRKVQAEGLKTRYEQDHEFSRWIRMIAALAFVPPANVVNAFEDLVEHNDFPDEALPIVGYFEDTYIGRRQRRGRRAPLFPIELWNVYQRTVDGQHRTNNDVEGWHRGFQTTCVTFYPHTFRFIECLKKTQGINHFEITQLIAGNRGNPRNKKYAAIAARIKQIVDDVNNRNIFDFLRGIAYNYEF